MVHVLYYIGNVINLTWCSAYFVMYLVTDPATVALLYRAGSAGWTLNTAVLYLLSIRLLESISERKISPIPGYCVILSSVFFFTAALQGKILATDFAKTIDGLWTERIRADDGWVWAYFLWFLAVSLVVVHSFSTTARIVRRKRHRRQIIFLFFPFSVVTALTVFVNVALPMLKISVPPIGHILVSSYLACFGYAIVKFRVTTPRPEIITDPLLFQISDIVILTDENGLVLRTNQAVTDLLGYLPEDLASGSLSAVLPDRAPPGPGTWECEAATAGGCRVPVHCTITPIDDAYGDRIGFFLLLKDLTQLKKLERLTEILQASNVELRQISVTDPLTCLCNRGRLENALDQEVLRCRRYGAVFSVILFDIDHFKNVNDTHGHAAGDAVLRAVSDAVRQSIRETDILGRWGGEEFLVVCVNTRKDAAGGLAEKIRVRFEAIRHRVIGVVTASLGVTAYVPSDTEESIVARADKAMYDAKNRGRNRISIL